MRANWITAFVSGVAFGAIIGSARRMSAEIAGILLPIGFFTSVLVGTVGLPQLKEVFAFQRKQGPLKLTTPIEGEARRVLVPLWLRVATWLVASGVVALMVENAQKA